MTRTQPPNTERYVTSKDDTLERIAILCGLSVSELMKLNGLYSRTIFSGQTLFVPIGTNERVQEAKAMQDSPPLPPRVSLDIPRLVPDSPHSKIMKCPARYLLPEVGSESRGIITVTPTQFFFEPDMSDMTAVELGFQKTSLVTLLKNISFIETRPTTHEVETKLEEDLLDATSEDATELGIYVQHTGKPTETHSFVISDEEKAKDVCKYIREWRRELVEEEEFKRIPLAEQLPEITGHGHERSFVPREYIARVRRSLPGTLVLAQWELLYSTLVHGISLSAFYRLVVNKGPTIMFVSDVRERIFGAFLPDSWTRRTDKYYGVGQAFLFTFYPKFQVFPWTGSNNNIMLNDDNFIGIGGGAFGLWMDEDFRRGTSRNSQTFNNDPLPGTEEFEVLHVEVYGFQDR